ncbi:MAG: carbon monoxide dehydrogenase subunit G, partial [Kofleriaceae bacterium]
MKLAGEYVFEAEIQEVWDALFDPAVLAAVMPGCEKLDLVDGSYVGEIKVKVGPIQGKFAGKVDLLDQVPPTSYRMVVDGKGAQGFVKATATIVLAAEGAKTRITYDSDAQVGGKIATVGQRLVETSARAIVKQSLEGLAENVLIRSGAHRRAKVKAAEAAEPVVVAPAATEESPRIVLAVAPPAPSPAVVVEPIT